MIEGMAGNTHRAVTIQPLAPPSGREGTPNVKTLVLGSGTKKVSGAVHVDIVADTTPDVVHDLNIVPWPLPDSVFTLVIASDVIEHLDDVIRTFEEIHRVCAPGATVRITVPHFSSANAFTDPTHRHYFGWFSCHYLTGEHEFAYYTRCRFRPLRRQLFFHPSLFNKIVWRLANRWPGAYEQRWAWMFPAWFLHFELEVVKQPMSDQAAPG